MNCLKKVQSNWLQMLDWNPMVAIFSLSIQPRTSGGRTAGPCHPWCCLATSSDGPPIPLNHALRSRRLPLALNTAPSTSTSLSHTTLGPCLLWPASPSPALSKPGLVEDDAAGSQTRHPHLKTSGNRVENRLAVEKIPCSWTITTMIILLGVSSSHLDEK